MPGLTDTEIQERLTRLPGWESDGRRIRKRYSFASFGDAIGFVNRVAALAEEMDHHPDILVEYKNVTLSLITHDVGRLTARDFRLAAKIDA